MREYQLYIDGEFCSSADGRIFESINPFDQSMYPDVPSLTLKMRTEGYVRHEKLWTRVRDLE